MRRMTEERGERAEGAGGAPAVDRADPVSRLPGSIRPVGAVVALGAIHAGAAAAVVALGMAMDLRESGALVAAWALAGVALAIPGVPALAAVGWRAERAISDQQPPAPGLWAAIALGVAMVAHWFPACALSPVLFAAGLLSSGSRADDHFAAGLGGLVAWVGTAVGLVIAAAAARAMQRRSWTRAGSITRPSTVPTSIAVGVAYGVGVAAPGLGWTAWLSDAWRTGAGSVPAALWVLVGCAAAAFAGGATGAWLRRAAPYAPAVAIGARHRQAEVAGAILATHWAVPFALGLTVLSDQRDVQWLVLALSTCSILVGTTLWSVGRTLRVEAARAVVP